MVWYSTGLYILWSPGYQGSEKMDTSQGKMGQSLYCNSGPTTWTPTVMVLILCCCTIFIIRINAAVLFLNHGKSPKAAALMVWWQLKQAYETLGVNTVLHSTADPVCNVWKPYTQLSRCSLLRYSRLICVQRRLLWWLLPWYHGLLQSPLWFFTIFVAEENASGYPFTQCLLED